MNTIIHKFYKAFQNHDAESMVACYHDDVTFSDPAFGTLHKDHAKNMWRMLIESQKGKDFQVYFDSIQLDNNMGVAHWEAKYTFSKTGRKVHNKIEASFKIKDGLIHEHHDNFNLHRWALQALGFKGLLLGWSQFFKKRFQQQTNQLLVSFENKKS